MITTSKLLREVDQLSPAKRIERVIAVARELKSTDPQRLADLLGELGAGDASARRLRVFMAAVTDQPSLLAEAVDDLDLSVASLALASPAVPDQLLASVLERGCLQLRRQAYQRVRREGRTELAGSRLEQVRARWGDVEAAALLPACDRATVARYLPELSYAIASWPTLVKGHLELVAEFAEAELSQLSGFVARQWWGLNEPLVGALIEQRPEVILGLAERHLTGVLPPVLRHRLVRLLGVDPARVVALLLADPERAASIRWLWPSRLACRRVVTLDDETVGAFIRASGPDARIFQAVLRALPPSRRAAVFDVVHAGRSMSAVVIPSELLALLPAPRRFDEARRMLTVPQLTRDPLIARTVAAHLPVDEARPILRAVTKSADAEERAQAYLLLIENAGREGDADQVVELLTWLARIRNERDPVRMSVLSAASRLPFRLLTPAALPALDRLIGDALDARDVSSSTMEGITQICFRVLWQSAAVEDDDLTRWALGTVERLGGWDDRALRFTPDLVRNLRHGQEIALWQYLRGPIGELLKRDKAEPLLGLARVLQRRAWPIDELQEMLRQATKIKRDSVIREAVRLWLDAPSSRAERVDELLAGDASLVTLPVVFGVLTHRRVDLLERYVLSGKPLRGRFGTKGAVWVPLVAPAVVLWWSARQQSAYRDLLRLGLNDTGGARWGRRSYARALAQVPGGGVDAVQHLIADEDELVAEAALEGLAHSLRPDRALPVLLANIDGDRARVAVYAASRCVRFVRPVALADLLGPLLSGSPKVVARKEMARLIALTRPPGAVELLLATWERPSEHRDVRIAVVANLIPFLADPRVQSALAQAANSPDHHVAAAIAGTSWRRLPSRARPGYGELVRAVIRHPHGPTASLALTAMIDWFRWTPGAAEDLRERLIELPRIDIWRSAAQCAANPAVWTLAPELPTACARALIEHLDDGENAGVMRDLPARQRLQYLIEFLCAHAAELRLSPAAGAQLSSELAGHDGFVVSAARLRVLMAVPTGDVETHLKAAAELLRDRPVSAARLAADLPPGDWTLPAVANTVDRLIRREGQAAGLFALAATRAAGDASGWASPWRDRLRGLRRHHQPDVREAALAVQTATE